MTALEDPVTAVEDDRPLEETPLDELPFDELAARVDELRDQVRHSEHGVQELLDETLAAITAFNRAGLVELVQVLRSDPRGEELLFDAVDRPEVMALLVSHEIVRVDRTLDVLRIVDQLRPALAASSVQLDVVRVEGDRAIVAFGGGCNAPTQAVRDEILQALGARLPSGMTVVEDQPSDQAFVPLTSLRVGPPS
jgi:Fe-S cluster biogenesis protein NfuA